MVVAKLKGARERKRALTGHKVEGRKSHAEGGYVSPSLLISGRDSRAPNPPRPRASPLARRGFSRFILCRLAFQSGRSDDSMLAARS